MEKCLSFFPKNDSLFLFSVSLAEWQHITAVKGETVHLKCPTPGANETSMDWKNQQGHILFFKLHSSKGNICEVHSD